MRLKIRPATPADSDVLLRWRNDPATRAASLSPEEVAPDEHERWLASVLSDPNRKLYVAELKGIPVGTVRADFADDGCELSWTVAPEARGRGVGKEMVEKVRRGIKTTVRAKIKVGNFASGRIATHAGLIMVRELDGLQLWTSQHPERWN